MWTNFFLLSCLVAATYSQIASKRDLEKIADGLQVTYDVITNTKEANRFSLRLILENKSDRSLDAGDWTIFFTHIYMLEPDSLRVDGQTTVEIEGERLALTHLQGSFFSLKPLSGFKPILPGMTKTVKLQGRHWTSARTDSMPNWYISWRDYQAVIKSTVGEELKFVTAKDQPSMWKRFDFDAYNPFTPQVRYERNMIENSQDKTEVRIIPKPYKMTIEKGDKLKWIASIRGWRVFHSPAFGREASLLSKRFAGTTTASLAYTGDKVIVLRVGSPNTLSPPSPILDSSEAYSLSIDATSSVVTITASEAAGAFYGVNSLVNLLDSDKGFPECTIHDGPRFGYRGVLLDLARNFHTRDEIIEVIKLMSMYKLNKLHLVLANDEGWRVEVRGLDELTSVGSRRCHDLEERTCLMPQLGSGPDRGPGKYLSLSDITSIKTEATAKHIEVIPEIGMPGNARAAVRAMEARKATSGSSEYGLMESGDNSSYLTAQMFTDNMMNPCLDSTYTFIGKVMDEIVSSFSPKTFHYGGNAARDAWKYSEACQKLKDEKQENSPRLYFNKKMSSLAKDKGVSLAAYEDGLLSGIEPFPQDQAVTTYSYTWDNIWEWGGAPKTYTLANAGYKVVMNHATHLYFDHPYEPDPEERGYYWATRFTDTQKVFQYNAKNHYSNLETTRSGKPISDEEKCGKEEKDQKVKCPDLEKPENIMGMEGCVFSEAVRTKEQLHDRLFPRLLALAERAWHEADWETIADKTKQVKRRTEDWQSFARAVGNRGLRRLEDDNVDYRIPPPGAKVQAGRLLTTAIYPGLTVQYSLDCGVTWSDVKPLVEIAPDTDKVMLRTKSLDGSRFSRTIVLKPGPSVGTVIQPVLDYIANNVTVNFKLNDNQVTYGGYYFTITLTNSGDQKVPMGNWAIYFTQVQWIEHEFLTKGLRFATARNSMYVEQVKGYLFKLGPTAHFTGLKAGKTLEIDLKGAGWTVSRYEQMPRWYVAASGMAAMAIGNTVGEDLSFVSDYDQPNQYLRLPSDKLGPWSPAARFDRNKEFQNNKAMRPIVPTPISYKVMDRSVSLASSTWTIAYSEDSLIDSAKHLSASISKVKDDVKFTISKQKPSSGKYIRFVLDSFDGITIDRTKNEAYHIKVDAANGIITVTSPTAYGIMNGVNSLIQLALQPGKEGMVAEVEIIDWPRYPYRGMHIDVARNFMPKDSIYRLLDVMGLYKINKLHFHLTDDEGWRLEIPGLEELTTVGARRCHDLTESECVMSTLGSGPTDRNNSGTGFYSVQDYKDILSYANKKMIEVIPEFDMPGHSHAPIIAMRARMQRLLSEGVSEENAKEYLLDDPEDPSIYLSIQMYDDNAINPCLDSTYKFIEKVVAEVKEMHKDIQPLKFFHFGGDEVAKGAWVSSPACVKIKPKLDGISLKEYFTRKVADITNDMTLGAWEDGIMEESLKTFDRLELVNREVVGYAWNNVWEWGGNRAYLLANAGYKVVLAPVTHTYFDHPQEPSPEERGFYWGTRYTDLFKSFSFMPDHYYMNADITRLGDSFTKKDVCAQREGKGCPELKNKENVIGMQGHLWSETVRLPSQLEDMIFPRLLALAERAWHKAAWEGKAVDDRKAEESADKASFANALSSLHLPWLDKLGIRYRIPPPGARQDGQNIAANTEFPCMKIQYRLKHSGWRTWSASATFSLDQTVDLRTVTSDGKRGSRVVKVYMKSDKKKSSASYAGLSMGLFLVMVTLSSWQIL